MKDEEKISLDQAIGKFKEIDKKYNYGQSHWTVKQSENRIRFFWNNQIMGNIDFDTQEVTTNVPEFDAVEYVAVIMWYGVSCKEAKEYLKRKR